MSMQFKPVIFVVISAILVAAIYSLSTFVVFASTTTTYQTKNSRILCVGDEKSKSCAKDTSGDVTVWMCTKNNGKWKCVEAKSVTAPPAGLDQALIKAQVDAKTGDNNTNVPKGLRGLNDSGITINPGLE